MNILNIANKVFEIEKKALDNICNKLDNNFVEAVNSLIQCKGRIIVCGMGKSGLIGKKISATFSSIGRPSFFLHPSEAIHGDLGKVMKDDCFISISNSGETDELLQLIPHIKKMNIKHICLTGSLNSKLAHFADYVLDIGIKEEASNLQAVPMASALGTLAMGHALAAVIIELSEFKHEDFALYHPGGSLGTKLLTKVKEKMMKTNLPEVISNSSIKDLLIVMSKGMLGLAVVSDSLNNVIGIITDGDLRRALEKYGDEGFFDLKSTDIMNTNPKSIHAEATLIEAEELMNENKISALLILENKKLLGIISKQHIK